MNRSQPQLLGSAARLAAIGGTLAVIAGVIQATVGHRIPAWTGNKHSHVALGLLTVALGAGVVVAARTLHSPTGCAPVTLTAITLWLAAVAILCSTTVGRLWVVPGALVVGAAILTLVACGWNRFLAVVATHWLRGLLGLLGVFEVLMAVTASSAMVVIAGLVAGGVLVAMSSLSSPGRRTIVLASVLGTLPFVALTWWTIVTPLITAVALAIGLAATGRGAGPVGAAIGAPRAPVPVGRAT